MLVQRAVEHVQPLEAQDARLPRQAPDVALAHGVSDLQRVVVFHLALVVEGTVAFTSRTEEAEQREGRRMGKVNQVKKDEIAV